MNDSLFAKNTEREGGNRLRHGAEVDALVVLDARQAKFASELCVAGGLRPAGVYVCDDSGGDLPGSLAGVPRHEDLRRAIADIDASAALVLSAGTDVGESITGDVKLLAHLRERGMETLLLPPAPIHLMELGGFSKRELAPVVVPRISRDPRFADLIELLEESGEPRSMQVVLTTPIDTVPLLGLMVDAAEVAQRIMGPAVSASCAVTVESSLSSLDRAQSLTGSAHMLLRNSGGRSCGIRVSDRGAFERFVRVIAGDRVITLAPRGIMVHGMDGEVVEGLTGAQRSVAEVCGEQVVRALDAQVVKPEPVETRSTLAIVEACLLSARTGSPESPDTMLQISGERGSA